jgi:glycosyltransferase involved in cell wall biosynthesis
MKTLEVIALVYKSVNYLKFIVEQIDKYCIDFYDVKVSYRIVANDPTPEVEAALLEMNVPHSIYHDHLPEAYYLNRVYRCWNFACKSSEADFICFINSDMAFSPNWLLHLYELHEQGFLPTSRLVESGKILSGQHAIMKNFGRKPSDFDENGWVKFAESIKTPKMEMSGLFMPVLFDKNQFVEAGMYPEGNIYNNGVGTCNGRAVISGDAFFFQKFAKLTGRQHCTSFSSLVYHIQEGEMDS